MPPTPPPASPATQQFAQRPFIDPELLPPCMPTRPGFGDAAAPSWPPRSKEGTSAGSSPNSSTPPPPTSPQSPPSFPTSDAEPPPPPPEHSPRASPTRETADSTRLPELTATALTVETVLHDRHVFQFRDAHHLAEYLTETSSGVVYSERFSAATASDNDSFVEVGRPIPGIQLRIVDETNHVLPEGEIGQLHVQGAMVTVGLRLVRDLAATIPGARYTSIKEADHLVLMERPDEMAELLTRFFTDQCLDDLPYCYPIETPTPRRASFNPAGEMSGKSGVRGSYLCDARQR